MNDKTINTRSSSEESHHSSRMDIVIVGHVDHGKSTVIGRLLHDTGSLPEGKLEQVKHNCELNSKPFEYAFLIDALKDEQSQGITIDVARVFFKSQKRNYIIIDAPGHIEFLKNMISGAARAEAALLVIDAAEGVRENSKRHGYMLSMLGVKQIAVLVNKMDLIDYDEKTYKNIVKEYSAFLKNIDVIPGGFVPVSGMKGDNVAGQINAMSWYKGPCVLDVLDSFTQQKEQEYTDFRMPVQDIYKFTRFGDSRRIIAGTINSGSINIGDEIVFYPSGKKSRVKTIETFNAPARTSAVSPYPVGFTMEEQIYVTRGEMAVRSDQKRPAVSSSMKCSIFWLGKKPMVKQREYLFKIGSAKIPVRLDEIHTVIDASDLSYNSDKETIDRHDVAECTLKCSRPVAFDLAAENALTSRFVIVDNYEISGGGIIQESVSDRQSQVRDKVYLRNYKWEKSLIPPESRSERYTQKSTLVLISGKKNTGKKQLARTLEKRLFEDGRIVYFLGIGNILYGVDADIKGEKEKDRRDEHIRRLAEVAHIMMEAGIILIVTAVELKQADLDTIKTIVNPDKIMTVWLGDDESSDLNSDMYIEQHEHPDEAVEIIKEQLQHRNALFRPW